MLITSVFYSLRAFISYVHLHHIHIHSKRTYTPTHTNINLLFSDYTHMIARLHILVVVAAAFHCSLAKQNGFQFITTTATTTTITTSFSGKKNRIRIATTYPTHINDMSKTILLASTYHYHFIQKEKGRKKQKNSSVK